MEKIDRFGWLALLEKYKMAAIFGLSGVILLVIGAIAVLSSLQEGDKIEIISEEAQTGTGTIFVDLEGAVQKSGVYELPFGSRIDDLLIAAGGLAVEADRDWVEKNLNRAAKLNDGVKIYIPQKGESSQPQKTQNEESSMQNELININTASQTKLEALWGIGPATAQKIIENRPYQAKDDLLTKKILKSNVYQKIADQLTVW